MEAMKPYAPKIFVSESSKPSKKAYVQVRRSSPEFGVSLSSVKRYARVAQRGASLAPRRKGGGVGRPRRMRPLGNCSKKT